MPELADDEFRYSCIASRKLTQAIVEQKQQYHEDKDETKAAKASITKNRISKYEEEKKTIILETLADSGKMVVQLASEKGASSWLTALPVKEFGYLLNKQQFSDAICLRYNLRLKDCPKVCACGSDFSVNHALICKKGGYVSMRHNWLRDELAKMMKIVNCKDVQTEPGLLPVNNFVLPRGTILGDQARLDISARSVWNPLERAFLM